jgi:hypothetical protein
MSDVYTLQTLAGRFQYGIAWRKTLFALSLARRKARRRFLEQARRAKRTTVFAAWYFIANINKVAIAVSQALYRGLSFDRFSGPSNLFGPILMHETMPRLASSVTFAFILGDRRRRENDCCSTSK